MPNKAYSRTLNVNEASLADFLYGQVFNVELGILGFRIVAVGLSSERFRGTAR